MMRKAFDWVVNAGFYIASALMGFITVLVTLNVLLRFAFNYDIAWVLEVTEYSLVFIAILASAYVLRVEQHISIDTILLLLKKRLSSLVNGFMSLVGVAICGIFCLGSALLTYQEYTNGIIMANKILQIPRYWLVLVLPVGFFLLTIQFILRASGYFIKKEPKTGF
ncbi:MAG: TRAP transporter small permease subunit [Peptococcaceae bacterium]|jgi:C4-dicarboxylate transporter DctQ subunit|nr:TRAP transporter small permease subunit [Peptococcaceae bacterium]